MNRILEITYAWYDSPNRDERMVELSKCRLFLPIDEPLKYDLNIYLPYCLKGNPFEVPKGDILKCTINNNQAIIAYKNNIFVFNGEHPKPLSVNPTYEEREARYEENPDDYCVAYGPYQDINEGESYNIHLCQIIETEKSFEQLILEEQRNRFLNYREYESIRLKTCYDKNFVDPDEYFDKYDDPILCEKVKIGLLAEFPQYFNNDGSINISNIDSVEDLHLLIDREEDLREEIGSKLSNICC